MSAARSAPAPTPAPLAPTPSPTLEPTCVCSEPPPFEERLQHLVSDFWSGRDDDSDSTLEGLQHLFISLARELGRVDGVARIFGVPRDEALKLLRVAYTEGKRAALSQHKRSAEDCHCEPAEILLREIESN